MDIDDKKYLLAFITRLGMYILPIDENNIVSFVDGYESGRRDGCDFTKLLTKNLEERRLLKGADGWRGQLQRYAYKNAVDFTTTFKHVSLDVLGESGLPDDVFRDILGKRIIALLERIDEKESYYFNQSWIWEWNSICLIEKKWFHKFWSEAEYTILKTICNTIKKNLVFEKKNPFSPTKKLLSLKQAFTNVVSKKGI